jgi:hypothetical protein
MLCGPKGGEEPSLVQCSVCGMSFREERKNIVLNAARMWRRQFC